MFLEKMFSQGKKENRVVEDMMRHMKMLCSACESFRDAVERDDRKLMRKVMYLEREGDQIRREIISHIHEGAFLPYLRPNLYKFVEIVDSIFDLLEDTAYHYLDVRLPETLRRECARVAQLNFRDCEMLLITFEAMLRGEALREKTLAIRIYEKKVDDLKFGLRKDIQAVPVEGFWQAKGLSDFISGLTSVSDIIEDASDCLQIIEVSMR
jgi:uncharacterized protein